MRIKLRIVLAVTALFSGLTLSAQILPNGSFEIGANLLSYTVYGGIGLSQQLPDGWSITNNLAASGSWTSKSGANNGDLAGYFGPAQEGSYFVGIQTGGDQGAASASIFQSISGLTIGQQYQINGYTRARDVTSETGTFNILTTNAGVLSSGSPLSDTVWNSFSTLFTATQTTDTVYLNWSHIANIDQTILFDNISIVAVPEPHLASEISLALFALIVFKIRQKLCRS